MPPMIATQRRSLSPSAKNIRLLLIRSDPQFHQRSLEGFAQVDRGESVSYEELHDYLLKRASDAR